MPAWLDSIYDNDTYETGYIDGCNSINVEAIYEEGYNSGYAAALEDLREKGIL